MDCNIDIPASCAPFYTRSNNRVASFVTPAGTKGRQQNERYPSETGLQSKCFLNKKQSTPVVENKSFVSHYMPERLRITGLSSDFKMPNCSSPSKQQRTSQNALKMCLILHVFMISFLKIPRCPAAQCLHHLFARVLLASKPIQSQ